MNYENLKEYAKNKRILMKEIAESLGVTQNGLKFSIENGTLPANKLKKLCEIVGITPNEFFSPDGSVGGSSNQQAIGVGGDVHQYSAVYTGGSGNGGGVCGACAACAAKDSKIQALQAELLEFYRGNRRQ